MPIDIPFRLAALPEYRIERLACRRTGRWIPPAEHACCLYCFGCDADVQSGIHARFCDFVRGRDPVHFGFPPDTLRDRSG